MKMVKEKSGIDFGGITEFTDEEIDIFLKAFGDVAALKERQEQEEARKMAPKTEMDQYLMGMDEDYDPEELQKRKQENMALQMDDVDSMFDEQEQTDEGPNQTGTFSRKESQDITKDFGYDFNKTATRIDPANRDFIEK